MRSTKPIRIKTPAHTGKPRVNKSVGHARWWTSTPAITTAVIGVVASGLLIAGYASGPAPLNTDTASGRTADHVVAQKQAPLPSTAPAKTPRAATNQAPPATPAGADIADASGESSATIAPVTIVGCLEQNDDVFKLKDASGDGVPKARSWKSGFLKKRTADIEVIDSGNRLTRHVGERVRVTGILVDRMMKMRSLQRVASSCDGASTKSTN